MDILILQGPRPAARGLPPEAGSRLWRVARAAGRVLGFRASATPADFAESIRRASHDRPAFVLVDPGECAAQADLTALRDALDGLAVPHAEVHDRSDELLELALRPTAQPIATIVIHGDLTASYAIALAVALRRMR
ncbi:MAG TPA: hypothetical protein VGD42_18730 [Lysobacter sp.]